MAMHITLLILNLRTHLLEIVDRDRLYSFLDLLHFSNHLNDPADQSLFVRAHTVFCLDHTLINLVDLALLNAKLGAESPLHLFIGLEGRGFGELRLAGSYTLAASEFDEVVVNLTL